MIKQRTFNSNRERFYRNPNEDFYRIKLLARDDEFIAEAFIDIEDVDKCFSIGWCYHHKGYVHGRVKGQLKLLHRFILCIENPKIHIDHRDMNGLDCRKRNLRIATRSQNGYNRKKYKRQNASLYKGVSWHSRDKIWQARIKLSGKEIFLGNFINQEEAGRKYNEKAIELHGEFARLNVL